MGNEQGKKIRLINSIGLMVDSNRKIDSSHLNEMLEQQAVILPDEYIIGVYQIVEDTHLESNSFTNYLFEQLKYLNSSLISLIFNPTLASTQFTNKKFLKIYDHDLNELKYEIETRESERIAVDTILDIKETEDYDEFDQFRDQTDSQIFLLQTVKNKVSLIIEYLSNTDPRTEGYYKILRETYSLISKLNYKQQSDIKESLVELENNYNLAINIGSLKQNLSVLNKVEHDLRKFENPTKY